MQDVYKVIEDYNAIKKCNVLIVFDDIIADMLSNKNLNQIVAELFFRERKPNTSTVFITQSYFQVHKDVRLHSAHNFVMKIPNNQEFQQITFNHSSDIDSKDFVIIYNKWTAKPYSFLLVDTTLASNNSLHYRKNFLEGIPKLIVIIYDMITDEKLQYNSNREASKLSAISA